MREDDLLRLWLHSLWVSCYYKSLSLSPSRGGEVAFYSLSLKEREALLTSNEIPAGFSQQMLRDLDLAIQLFVVS